MSLTHAISSAHPTKLELNATDRLRKALEPLGVFETEEEQAHRREVLGKMNELVTTWIRETVTSHASAAIAEKAGGQIFTFGSFRLGVNNRDGDIDTLVVAPRFVSRADFFDTFYKKLEAHPATENLHSAQDAFVPVIKLDFMGIEMDLLFARLAMEQIPADIDLKDMTILKNLDEKCVLSLNGCRVTDSILSLVPNDVEAFRLTLRAIKQWAKKRAVYSNVLGYVGGVQCAMLVARICQLYPNACAATLVQKFFHVWKEWEWPNPVLLCDIVEPDSGYSSCREQWNPSLNMMDAAHKMPIITPAFPCQNSTVNVGVATLGAMIDEFSRGARITNEILMSSGRIPWSKLWEPSEFFLNYKQFICIKAVAPDQDSITKFAGLVQSCIRKYVDSIPETSLGVPYPKEFSVPQNNETDPHESAWYIGLKRAPGVDRAPGEQLSLDLRPAERNLKFLVDKKKKSSHDLDPELREDMFVFIEQLRSADLPEYVFPDERRPVKKKRKKKKVVVEPEVSNDLQETPEAPETQAQDMEATTANNQDNENPSEPSSTETNKKRTAQEAEVDDLELDERASKVLKPSMGSTGGPRINLHTS